MIYKVYYQEDPTNTPRREKTKSLYAEAEGIPDLKEKITKKYNFSIEYVTELNDNELDYEKENNPDFEILKDI